MNVYQFHELLNSIPSLRELDTRSYKEIFIKKTDDNKTIFSKTKELTMERITDYLEFLELFDHGIISYEFVFDDVLRIFIELSKDKKFIPLAQAS